MNRSTIRSMSIVGLIAQLVFVASTLIATFWQGARYSPVKDSISDLYAIGAPHAVYIIVIFTLCGAATIVFALLALWPALRPANKVSFIGPLLLSLSIYGVGDLFTPFERLSCSMAAPSCTSSMQTANAGGQLDNDLSTIGILLFIASLFFLAKSMSKTENGRRASQVMLLGAVYMILSVVAIGALHASTYTGLVERLLAFGGAALIAAMAAFNVRRSANSLTSTVSTSQPNRDGRD